MSVGSTGSNPPAHHRRNRELTSDDTACEKVVVARRVAERIHVYMAGGVTRNRLLPTLVRVPVLRRSDRAAGQSADAL